MKPGHKFMMSLGVENWKLLSALADKRGITVQEYMRVIIVPDFLESHRLNKQSPRSHSIDHVSRAKKGWETRRKNMEKAELESKNIAYPGEGVLKP